MINDGEKKGYRTGEPINSKEEGDGMVMELIARAAIPPTWPSGRYFSKY